MSGEMDGQTERQALPQKINLILFTLYIVIPVWNTVILDYCESDLFVCSLFCLFDTGFLYVALIVPQLAL